MTARPRIGVSRCLLGEQVRYDGGHRALSALAGLAEVAELVGVCPEFELGMGVPRPPVDLVAGRMLDAGGVDWSAGMRRFAAERVEALLASGLDGFVLKARSPSCGPGNARSYDALRRERGREAGLFALALRLRCPTLPLVDETGVGPQFLEAVFAHQRRDRYDVYGVNFASHRAVDRFVTD